MALLFMDGFDNYATIAIGVLGKWQSFVNVGGSALTIDAGAGRFGTNALKLVVAGSAQRCCLQGVTLSIPRMVLGVAIRVDTFETVTETPILSWLDASTFQLTMSFLPNGQIRFRQGGIGGTILATSTSSVLTSTGTYFYLEVDVIFNSLTGAIVLHANGANAPLSASTGLNTAPSGTNSFNTYQLGMTGGGAVGANSSACHFDDFYILSTTGGTNTGFLGDVRVVTLFPSAPGSTTQFAPFGAAADWQCVNEASEDGDTTYAFDTVVGDKDIYNHGATPANTGQIFGVQLDSVARKDDAAGRSIANTVLSGATAHDGATQPLSQTYAWYLDIMENDPNTSTPWTKTTVDAVQFGAKIAA